MDCCQDRGKGKTKPKLCLVKEDARSDFVKIFVSESTKVDLNVKAKCVQLGNNNRAVISDPEIISSIFAKPRVTDHEDRQPSLRLTKSPELPIRVRRRISRRGFPDGNDHEFVVTAYKNNFPGSSERLNLNNNNKKGKRYEITASVKLCEPGDQTGETKDQWKLLQSGANGEAFFAFRFHTRQAKLSIKFTLEVVPAQGSSKGKREVLSEVTVEVATENGKPRQRKLRDKRDDLRDSHDHYSASGSEVCETELEMMKSLILQALPPSSASAKSVELRSISYQIMRRLHHPRDNGRWQEFDKLADELTVEYPDPDSQIAIMLERSVAACYRKDLDRSADMIQKVCL